MNLAEGREKMNTEDRLKVNLCGAELDNPVYVEIDDGGCLLID